MILRRIAVQNFRKLVEPVVIENLSDKLVIIVGDNEEGKSTLLQAIRSCFFDKHNMTGERAQSFQPYNSSTRPEVRVEFEINGKPYKLFKAFCYRPQAELTTPTGVLLGSAAEEELARILRFTAPQRASRSASDHEHEGIFGMFWVEQGKSYTGLQPTADGRSTIQQALQQEVGDVLGGKRGQKILAEVTNMRNELLTATGRPKGEYAKATDRLLEIQAELATVEIALNDYGRKLEDLERCRARQRRYEADRTMEHAEERLQHARESFDRIAALQGTLQHAETELAKTTAEHNLAANRAGQRNRLLSEVDSTKRRAEQLQTTWDAKQDSLAKARQQVESGEKQLLHAAKRFEGAAAAHSLATASELLARSQAELERSLARERDALLAKAKAEHSLEAASGIGIEKKDITRLKHLNDEVTKARGRIEALATNVKIDLETGVKARIGRAAVVSGAENRITEATTIDIPDCARIKIVPGGDIADPLAESKNAQEKLQRALNELGVSKFAEAEARLEDRQNLLNEAKKYQELVAAHAPEGLEVLQGTNAELRGEITRLAEQVGAKPKSLKHSVSAVKDAQRELDMAEVEHKRLERRIKQAREDLAAAQTDEAGCKASFESEEHRFHELEERLAEERKKVSDSDLQNAVLEASQRVATAERTATAARMVLEAANPESAKLELEAAGDALKQLVESMRALSDRVIRVESDLRASGAQGLGERSQQLEGELNVATAVASTLERRAKAVELLHHVLTEAEKKAKEIFLRPVTSRVQPYLKLLLPGSELRLSEEMDIIGLRRGDVEEKFASLSIGTREQLAVLTRLAFADLLRENGQPAAVLLDDAIVFADDDRFTRMIHILRKAAEKTQILIFTCRERDYLAAGAPILRLADCRA
jgi:chromosome segregation ATPase